MGEKDITQKNFEAYNDVFADIINGCLFDGEKVIFEFTKSLWQSSLDKRAIRTASSAFLAPEVLGKRVICSGI